MKAIENMSLFQRGDYHRRFFKLEFGQAECFFYENHNSSKVHKRHRQTDIIQCFALEDDEINAKVEEREEKRSSSFMKRKLRNQSKRCSWNFAFTLTFIDKEYELYAATRTDRDHWVKILNTIAEINREGIKNEGCNVLEYLR